MAIPRTNASLTRSAGAAAAAAERLRRGVERARGEVKTILGWSDAEFLRQLTSASATGSAASRASAAVLPIRFALTRVPEQVRARLALIGNAAHTVHPVAGQGFNLGLRDVAAVVDILVDAQRAGDDIGDLRVLRRYADWRRHDNQVISLFTNGLIRIFPTMFFRSRYCAMPACLP